MTNFVTGKDYTMTITFCLFLTAIIVFLIYGNNGKFANIILLGFILRLFVMVVDLYHIFPVLHSGSDSEAFHAVTMHNVETGQNLAFTNYTLFLTVIYNFFEDYPREVAQFINVLFGIGAILIVRRCMRLYNVPHITQKRIIMLLSFMPNFIILSAILLREAWIIFFVALSAMFFLQWMKSGGAVNMILSPVPLLAASYMHSGVIAIALGYALAFILYKPQTHSIKFTPSSIIPILLVFAGTVFFFANLDTFGEKFMSEDNDEFLEQKLSTMTWEGGGSDYLTWLNVSSLSVSIATLPLRMVYFLFSPIPFDWRGLGDIIAFITDSCVYLWLCWKIYKAKRLGNAEKTVKRFLTICIVATVVVFAFGTKNSGTAMRHRLKILPVIVLTYAITQGSMLKDNESECENNIIE